MISLTIAIPTYNRKAKVEKLLNILTKQISNLNTPNLITILVSNNNSDDGTDEFLKNFTQNAFEFKYINQEKNLGFDGNIKFLYDNSDSDYIWFHSDDDIPLEGSLVRLLDVLNDKTPQLILFSFQQPINSPSTQFNFTAKVHQIIEPKEIIKNIWSAQKISTWIIKKVVFNTYYTDILNQHFWPSGYFFMSIAFTTFQSSNGILCIISDQLISCDADYNKFFFDPKIFLSSTKVLNHPYILLNYPSFLNFHQNEMEVTYIRFLYQIVVKKYFISSEGSSESYKEELKKIKFTRFITKKKFKIFLQYLIIKLKLCFV